MVGKYGAGQDPYCYKETNILINKFGIKEEPTLNQAERELTTAALNAITFSLPPYDFEYFRKIHFTLFSSIYEWAGDIRKIDISKQETRFCTYTKIEAEADKVFNS